MTTRSDFIIRADGTPAVHQGAGDALDYGLDHADLLDGGDAIISSTWSATEALTINAPSVTGSVVSALIGGTGGSVTNTVETATAAVQAMRYHPRGIRGLAGGRSFAYATGAPAAPRTPLRQPRVG